MSLTSAQYSYVRLSHIEIALRVSVSMFLAGLSIRWRIRSLWWIEFPENPENVVVHAVNNW